MSQNPPSPPPFGSQGPLGSQGPFGSGGPPATTGPFSTPPPPPPAGPGSSPQWSAHPPGGGSNGKVIAVLIALLVAAVAGAGYGIWVLATAGDDTDAAETTVAATTAEEDEDEDEDADEVESDDRPVSTERQTAEPPASAAVTTPAPTDPTVTTVDVTNQTTPTTALSEPVNLFAGAQAAGVIAEVAEARGGSPLRILSVNLYPEYAFVRVQDPNVPENVDEYSWRTTLAAPTPVRLTAADDLDAGLFTHDEVDWEAIPALVAAAPTLLELPDGVVTHVNVHRPLPFSTDVEIRVFVSTERSGGFVDADAQGTVLEVVRS